MSNALLAWRNRIDAATLSGGDWLGSLPLENLKNRRLGKLARSVSAALADTTFDFDLGVSRFLRLFALVSHNLSLDAKLRLRLSEAADFSTLAYDTGWIDVWPVVYPFGTFVWGDPRTWTGKYSEEELEGYTRTRSVILPPLTLARYGRVEFDDQANAAGYVQLGRVFIADGWQPAINLAWNGTHGLETQTEAQRARSGALYFDRAQPYRVERVRFARLTEDEAMAGAFEIQRQMGIDGEVFYVHDPDDTVHLLRRSFLGHIRQLSPIAYPYLNIYDAPFEIEELL